MASVPLVFLPGLLCDERLWRDQANALSDVVDASIADLTLDDSVQGMAARVLAGAPPSFALAALSMGGYVAFEIMRQAPYRVTRLALFDTSAAPDSNERVADRKAGIAALANGRFSGVTSRLLPKLVHTSQIDNPVGDEVKAMAARVGREAFIRQQSAILGRPDSRPILSTIQVPTLVAVGIDDVLTPPKEAQAMHWGISGSKLYVFAECGHLPALEKPSETGAVLRRWLTSKF